MWRVKERWWFPSLSLLAMQFTEVHYTGGKFRYEFSFICAVCKISIKHPSRETEVDILLLNTQSWTSEKRCVLKVYIWKLSLSNGWRFEYIWDCLHRILGGRGRKKGRRRRRRGGEGGRGWSKTKLYGTLNIISLRGRGYNNETEKW